MCKVLNMEIKYENLLKMWVYSQIQSSLLMKHKIYWRYENANT
jgi:hypothetical protein